MCLRPEGVAFHGSQAVAANILNYGYLWNRVRVQGGAYGVGLIPRDDGDCLMYSYRDPSPAHTLKVFKGAAASLIDFAEENQDISRFILGSVSAFDPYLNAVQKIMTAESRYFKGMDEETVCQHYRELIQTTSEDLIRFADALNIPSCRSAHAIVASSL